VDPSPSVARARIVEVVVADDADVRQSQRLDVAQVVLVALDRAWAGEVAEVGEEHRRGLQSSDLPDKRGEDRIRGRVGPCSAVAGDHERERVLRRRLADTPRHP